MVMYTTPHLQTVFHHMVDQCMLETVQIISQS